MSKIITTFAAMLGKRCAIWILVIACCAGMWSCSSHRLEEAQATVATADSLWHNGQCLSDSAQLAQAYHTLHRRRAVYSDEYAHACYHYGKLLRAKDDPVAAMQCFINASHSRTHDYHILGRIYSNMGSICHLAGEYALSYDMYERSANVFLQDKDTLSYYYMLNDIAYELAEQKDSVACVSILHKIEHLQELSIWTALTKAELYKNVLRYDSAIYYVDSLYLMGVSWPVCSIIKAQSFSELGEKDSAILYATRVIEDTISPYQHRFNALYILSHNDTSLNSNEIRDMTSQREDIRYYEYEPQMEKLKDAVRLLHKTLTHKPNLGWLYTLLGTLLAGAVLISWYISRKHKKHELLSQQIDDLETGYADLRKNRTTQIEHICATLRSSDSLSEDLNWKNFNQLCIFVNEHFYLLASKLQQKKILNETEIRLCVLVLIGLTRSDIAHILPYALNSVGKLKDHTAKKLGTTGKNLHDFLLQMAVEG